MNAARITLVVSLLALGLGGWSAWTTLSLRSQLSRQAATSAADRRRLAAAEAGARDLGEVMSALQMHLAKLHYAGRARNWDLATFEREEVGEQLEAAARLRPEERGVRLGLVIRAFRGAELTALDAAIRARDQDRFAQAYGEVVAACNRCHRTVGRPYIRITVPTAPPVSNQRWEPPGAPAWGRPR